MQVNVEELKRLAESVVNADNIGDGIAASMDFMEAINPTAILELIRQRDELLSALEKERRRLDWALKKQAYYGRSPDRLWVDVGAGNHKWFAVHNDNPRATIDELIVSAASAKAEG